MKNNNSSSTPELGKTDWETLRRQCSVDSIRALERSLSSLEAGQAPTPSFKLYGKTDISVVTDFFSSLRKDVAPQWMLDYEKSRQEKFGPQGGHAPWSKLIDDFLLYKSRPVEVATISERQLKEMQRNYASLRCQMLSASDTLQYLKGEDKIQTRAAGWNTFDLKKTDPKAQSEALRLVRNGEWKQGSGYVFSRYNKLKKRIFMPMPFSSMIKQAQYFVPFLTGIQNDLRSKRGKSSFTFWADKIGFEACFEIMSELYQAKAIPSDWKIVFIQRDFEKMDTTTGSSQYERIFVPCLDAAFHQRMEDLRAAMLFTTNAPIICPSGTMTGNHGTASGAEVTNGGETVCNDYYDHRLREIVDGTADTTKYILVTTQGNGDDGTSVYAVKPDYVEQFRKIYTAAADQAAQECGFRTQADKWRIDLEFGLYCQNMYWLEGSEFKWAYPATLILNSIVNPEHEYTKAQWDKDYRDIDIIEKLDNGVGLPYYHELVDYVCEGTKYPLLGSSEEETKRILSKYDRYRELQYQTERFNRESYNISNSPTVKYILSKRK